VNGGQNLQQQHDLAKKQPI